MKDLITKSPALVSALMQLLKVDQESELFDKLEPDKVNSMPVKIVLKIDDLIRNFLGDNAANTFRALMLTDEMEAEIAADIRNFTDGLFRIKNYPNRTALEVFSDKFQNSSRMFSAIDNVTHADIDKLNPIDYNETVQLANDLKHSFGSATLRRLVMMQNLDVDHLRILIAEITRDKEQELIDQPKAAKRL